MAFTALEFQRLLRREPDKNGKPPRLGAHSDGDGLYVVLGKADTAASWIFRYTRPSGRVGDYGLGPATGKGSITLADARGFVVQLRAERARCQNARPPIDFDPIAERQAKRAAEKPAPKAPTVPTFEEIAERYLAVNAPTWKNEKHKQQWRNTLATYVYPKIGAVPVDQITTAQVTEILGPLWLDKHETASRIRGRIEVLLDFATPEYRRAENPARLRLLKLPKRKQVRKVRPVKHHPALPFDQAPVFMADLATRDTISAKALRFTILTAARTSESRFATWPEIDLDAATWALPAERTKTTQDHVVPLSAPVVELLRELKAESDGGEYVFSRAGEPVSENAMLSVIGRMSADRLGVGLAPYVDPKRNNRVVTTHGFRSTFRDWASEETSFQGEVVEMALAHAVSDEVEGAYRRGTLLKKRRDLMDAWAAYCAGPRVGNVVSLRGA